MNENFEAVLRQRRSELDQEQAPIEEQLLELKRRSAEIGEQIAHIDALLGNSSAGEPENSEPPTAAPRNPTADAVVNLLQEVGEPLHYKEIERGLRARGVVEVEGKNPANILLARFFNDPRLYRPARGTYALRNGRSTKSVGAKRKRSRGGK